MDLRRSGDDIEGCAAALQEHGIVTIDGLVSPELAGSFVPFVLGHVAKRRQPIGFDHAPTIFNIAPRCMELAAHPVLLAVAQRVIGGRDEPLPNAHAVPKEDQIRVHDANGVGVEP